MTYPLSITDSAPPAEELVYAPRAPRDVMGFFAAFIVALIATAAFVFYLWLGLLVSGLAIAIVAKAWKPKVRAVVLRVEGRRFRVFTQGFERRDHVNVPITAIASVSLDTKPQATPAAVEASAPIEGARIAVAIESSGGASIVVLTDEYYAHEETREWMEKVRTFLRSHSWIPKDERDFVDAVLDPM